MSFIRFKLKDFDLITPAEIKQQAEKRGLIAVDDFENEAIETTLTGCIEDFERENNFIVMQSEWQYIFDAIPSDMEVLIPKGNLSSILEITFRNNIIEPHNYNTLLETSVEFGGVCFNENFGTARQGYIIKAEFGFSKEKPLPNDLKLGFIYKTLRALTLDVGECDECFKMTPKSLEMMFHNYKRYRR
jgi:hypothetical protein